MEKKSLSVLTYENIKEKIIFWELAPGAILNEREIAESLGISRTPVREALQHLLQEGWVTSGNGNGKSTRVSSVTSRDVEEIIQIRKLVENHAMEQLFKEGEPKVLAGQLYCVLSEMKDNTQNLRTFIQLDLEFHNLLISGTKNSRLVKFWATIHDELTRYFMMVLEDIKELPEIAEEHEMLVSALWAQDQERCMKIMRKHLRRNYTSLLKRVKIISG